jgi:MoaA/NifB/PqqE/SkfB family radical SAM enzyme
MYVSIHSIDLMLTAKCNLQCPFCYGPNPNEKHHLDATAARLLSSFFRERGISGLILAGGEPLAHPDVVSIIRSLRRDGFTIALHTNGTFPDRLMEVLPEIACLCLPLDSMRPDTNLRLRSLAVHGENILALLTLPRIVSALSSGLKLKIGTVVTKYNVEELFVMAQSVASVQPDLWKLYEVRRRGAADANWDTLHVCSELIEERLRVVRREFPSLNVVFSRSALTERAYVILDPDTELLVTLLNGYESAGRLIVGDQIIEAAWERALELCDHSVHRQNVQSSFPAVFS